MSSFAPFVLNLHTFVPWLWCVCPFPWPFVSFGLLSICFAALVAVLASLTFRICLSFVFFGLQLCWSGLSCCLLDICFVLSHPVHFLSPHRSTVSCLILAHLLFLASSVFVTHDNNVKFYIRTFCLGSKLQVFGSNHSPQEKFLVIASSSPA